MSGIDVRIKGVNNKTKEVSEANTHSLGTLASGIVAYTHRLEERIVAFTPALNDEFGIEMAIDSSFGGTPVEVHDGTDSVDWTATTIIGTKFTFDSTDQANTGTKSIKSNKAALNDVFQLDNGSDFPLTSSVAITMFVFVDTGWSALSADSVSVIGFDTGSGTAVGNSVLLEDFFQETEFDVWHKLSINLDLMGLVGETIDAFRIQIVAKSGSGPLFYIDDFQLENTGGATNFEVSPPAGRILCITSASFTFIDALSITLLSNSAPNLSYNKILGVTKLTNGILFQNITGGQVIFSSAIRCIGDSIRGGNVLENIISDDTNTSVTSTTTFLEPIELDSSRGDKIRIVIADDLSGLISFTYIARGFTIPLR